ncbi:cobalamin B12-binding domain-containing protein [Nostoc sp. NIES-2111]
MDDGDGYVRASDSVSWGSQAVAPPFIDPDILQQADLSQTRDRLAQIVQTEILPRLVGLHAENANGEAQGSNGPAIPDIVRLAHLVLDPDIDLSVDFIVGLRKRGLSMDGLFVNLLEPAARCLGTMWDNDECSFVDVTLGVGRLQQLLAMLSSSFAVPAFSEKRRVLMMAIAEEKHSFGVTMVEKFLRAGGWDVRSERGTTLQQVSRLMRNNWFAVAGLTASSDRQLDSLAATIHQIRQHSCNPAIGIMVGGPPFTACPELAAQVGADATAVNAPTAVILAQRLFDIGSETNWKSRRVWPG